MMDLLYTAVEHLNFFLSLSSNVISHVAYDVVRQLVNRAPCTPFFFSTFCQLESKLYLFGSHYRVYHITSFRLLEDSLTFCLTIMLYPKSLALWNRTLHDLTILTWDKPSPSFFFWLLLLQSSLSLSSSSWFDLTSFTGTITWRTATTPGFHGESPAILQNISQWDP